MNLTQPFEDFVRAGLYLKGWSPRTPPVYRRAWASYTRFQQSQCKAPVQQSVSSNGATEREPESSLTRAQLEAWIISRREAGMKPAGINFYIRSLNSFCTWLKKKDTLASQSG